MKKVRSRLLIDTPAKVRLLETPSLGYTLLEVTLLSSINPEVPVPIYSSTWIPMMPLSPSHALFTKHTKSPFSEVVLG